VRKISPEKMLRKEKYVIIGYNLPDKTLVGPVGVFPGLVLRPIVLPFIVL
jgi:hypothetical protein